MADFLDLIKGEGLAVQFIKSLVSTPASAASILTQLRSAGLGIRTQTGYQVINYLRSNVLPSQTYLQNLANNVLPNVGKLSQSVTTQLRNYSYKVTIKGISALSGEPVQQFVTISTNSLLTKQEAMSAVENMVSNAEYYDGIDSPEIEVTDIGVNSAGLV
jgi:hypothetical protein